MRLSFAFETSVRALANELCEKGRRFGGRAAPVLRPAGPAGELPGRRLCHHIARCCLALLCTLKERIACAEAVPLLSVRDLVERLDFYLPRRARDPAAVLERLRTRHAARTAATASARKNRGEL